MCGPVEAKEAHFIISWRVWLQVRWAGAAWFLVRSWMRRPLDWSRFLVRVKMMCWGSSSRKAYIIQRISTDKQKGATFWDLEVDILGSLECGK